MKCKVKVSNEFNNDLSFPALFHQHDSYKSAFRLYLNLYSTPLSYSAQIVGRIPSFIFDCFFIVWVLCILERGFRRGMISDFRSNYFKISVICLSKYKIYVSINIPISDIRQKMCNFSEFLQENRPISVFRSFRNPP